MKLILISPWTVCGFLRTVLVGEQRRPKVQKVHGRESTCKQGSVVSELVRIVSTQGQWNVLVYELSATVIHLVACHAFAADISVWFAGKSYHGVGEKSKCHNGWVFAAWDFSLIGYTQREWEYWKKKMFPNHHRLQPGELYLYGLIRTAKYHFICISY